MTLSEVSSTTLQAIGLGVGVPWLPPLVSGGLPLLGGGTFGRYRRKYSNRVLLDRSIPTQIDSTLTSGAIMASRCPTSLCQLPRRLVIAVFAGFSWTAMISTPVAGLPLFLPTWVMGRGMTIYTMVFAGRQALGALIWGIIASQVGLRPHS
jgi:hypothetical protein